MHSEEEFSAEESAAIKHFTAVGMVATAWASLEAMIDGNALVLAGLSERPVAHCFTAQVIGVARKLDAYIAIAKFRGADSFAGELDKFAKETMGLAEQRNRIIHDPWFVYHPDGPRRLEITARRKLKVHYVSVATEEVIEFHNTVTHHGLNWNKLHERIMGSLEPPPGESLPTPRT